jgi:aryl-alcohol dehydrogenase-like predicted oxidoreductase
LGTDRIDLYQFHLGDFDPVAAVEVRETLEQLVSDGLIRAYGWSTDDPDRAAVFAEGEHCVSIQHELSVFRDAAEMLELCETTELISVNRTPLAMGILTGKFSESSRLPRDDMRGVAPSWLRYFRDGRPVQEWLERLAAIREILTSDGRTLAAGALDWILARGRRTVPIPGFRTVAQVEENLSALAHAPLSHRQLLEIDQVLERLDVPA